jgi:hypothetical protein
MDANTYIWTGATSNDPNLAENWLVQRTGAVSAVIPGSAAADSLLFDGRAVAACGTTNFAVLGTGSGIVNVTVRPDFAYTIGSQANPLRIVVTAAGVWNINSAGAGNCYLVSTGGTLTVLNVTGTAPGADALHLAAIDHAITKANITGGNVTFDDVLGIDAGLAVASMDVSAQASGSEPSVTLGIPVSTLLNVFGGTVDWLKGTIAELRTYSGTLRCEKSLTARTLTASKAYGGTVDLRTGVPLTVTLTAAILQAGGQVHFDIGTNLQQS